MERSVALYRFFSSREGRHGSADNIDDDTHTGHVTRTIRRVGHARVIGRACTHARTHMCARPGTRGCPKIAERTVPLATETALEKI